MTIGAGMGKSFSPLLSGEGVGGEVIVLEDSTTCDICALSITEIPASAGMT